MVWDKGGKQSDQFSWRTHTTEYSSDTLIGNWNEERFDVAKLASLGSKKERLTAPKGSHEELTS